MIKVWAHRGAKGYYPENTLVSFEAAIKQGADGIELDVHLSKDGYVVVCHDEILNRTTNGKGFIKNYNLYELKQLDAGSWFDKKYKDEKLPMLDEVMELIKGTNITLNIELKAGSIFYQGIEEKVLKMVQKFNLVDRVIISSFDHHSIVKIKNINSEIKTGMLYMESLYNPLKYIESLGVDAIHPNYTTLTEKLINDAVELNLDINTYTVNLEDDIKKLKHKSINAIITDYPDRTKDILSM